GRRDRAGGQVTLAVPFVFAELVRTPGRTVVRVLTLAAAVGLLGAMLLFIGHSLQTMTAGAVRSVPLDWQGPVGSYHAAERTAAGVRQQPGVAEAVATATAPFAGLEHASPALGTIRSGAGAGLDVPPVHPAHRSASPSPGGAGGAGERGHAGARAAGWVARRGRRGALPTWGGGRSGVSLVRGNAIASAPAALFPPLTPRPGPAPAQPRANSASLS